MFPSESDDKHLYPPYASFENIHVGVYDVYRTAVYNYSKMVCVCVCVCVCVVCHSVRG